MVNITRYKLELVKETGQRYDHITEEINSPENMVNLFQEIFNVSNQSEEVMLMAVLNTKNRVVGVFEVSRGLLDSSQVHPREIYKRALLLNGKSIIIAHNHPSGDPDPSKADDMITARLESAGEIIGIKLLDHLVIGGTHNYYSYRSDGRL